MSRPILSCVPVNCEGLDLPHWRSDPKEDGYEKTTCEECGREVWIGPRQRQMQMVLKGMPLCVICCVQAAKEQGCKGVDVKSLEDYAGGN